jgi:hypothetical protein
MAVGEIVSVILGVISAVLAIEAIRLAHLAETEVRQNFRDSADVLAEIRAESAAVKATIDNSHNKLLDTTTHLLTATLEPQEKLSVEEQIRVKAVDLLSKQVEKNPAAMQELLDFVQTPTENQLINTPLISSERINKPGGSSQELRTGPLIEKD